VRKMEKKNGNISKILSEYVEEKFAGKEPNIEEYVKRYPKYSIEFTKDVKALEWFFEITGLNKSLESREDIEISWQKVRPYLDSISYKRKMRKEPLTIRIEKLFRSLSFIINGSLVLSFFKRALWVCEKINYRQGMVGILQYIEVGSPEEARKYYEKALKLSQTICGAHRETLTKSALTYLAEAYRLKGDGDGPEKALECLEDALELSKNTGDKWYEADILRKIGFLRLKLGKEKALEYMEKSLYLSQIYNYKKIEANALAAIGNFYARVDKNDKAFHYFYRALKLSQKIGFTRRRATVLADLATLYRLQGKIEKSIEYLKEAKKAALKCRYTKNILVDLLRLANAYQYQEEFQKAIAYSKQVLDLSKDTYKEEKAKALKRLGDIYVELNNQKSALEYLNEAEGIFRELGYFSEEIFTLVSIGNAYRNIDLQKSFGYYQNALKCLEVASLTSYRASIEIAAFNGMGDIYREQGKFEESVKILKKTLEISKDKGYKLFEAVTCYNIANTYYDKGDQLEAARDYCFQGLSLISGIKEMRFLDIHWRLRKLLARIYLQEGKEDAFREHEEARRVFKSTKEKLDQQKVKKIDSMEKRLQTPPVLVPEWALAV